MSRPARTSPLLRPALLILLATPWPALAQDAAPRLVDVTGRVELLSGANTWQPQAGPGTVEHGLRTGTGRAVVQNTPPAASGAQVLFGSASSARRYRNELDLLTGRFLLTGPVAVHVKGHHVVMDGAGRARVDLPDGPGRAGRIAVLSGLIRVALGGKTVEVRAGQQLELLSGAVSAFRETDAWYAAQFSGEGLASVEALRGGVSVTQGSARRSAVIGDELRAGQRVNTDAAAWAEVGFSGGGYLRLAEQSELTVLSVDRLAGGKREVQLALTRGSAWNVVQRGQGGYRIDTPVVSTAVRGTVFRVDASGVVKVIEGQVGLPSQADQVLASGQQRSESGAVQPLTLDAQDQLNLALDAQRRSRLTLNLDGLPRSLNTWTDATLLARSLPDGQVRATLSAANDPALTRTLDLTAGAGGDTYRAGATSPDLSGVQALPDGRYTLSVTARRGAQSVTRRVPVTLDRAAPTLEDPGVVRQGRLLIVRGRVQDALSRRVTLSLRTPDGQLLQARRVAPGPFTLLLPLLPAVPPGPLTLTARDEAGNEHHVTLP